MDPDGVLVIGYGSTLRGDDAAGRLAARRLATRGFQAIEVQQLTPELAESIAAARGVFFVDACVGLTPGEISVEPVAWDGGAATLEHHASPAALLRLAREAYGVSPPAWLIGLGGADFEVGDGLSAGAELAVGRAVGVLADGNFKVFRCAASLRTARLS